MTINILDIYQEFYNYNNKLIPALEQVVEHLQQQAEDQALSLFIHCLEGIQWSLDVMILSRPYHKNMSFDVDAQKVQDILASLNESLENQDYVLMADILEYELIPLLKQFHAETEKNIEENKPIG
jgi:hypothetical protein